MNFALIGHPLGHSWSKSLFDDRFGGLDAHRYALCPLTSLEWLRPWVAALDLRGFNVTIPYKQAILPLLDSVSSEAQAIGAVNCVSVEHGQLIGHNTDAAAFRETLTPLIQPWHDNALILGTGGAAHAVAYVLRQLGIEYHFVSRHPSENPQSISYPETMQLLGSHRLIINATPLGISPHCDATPLESLDGITPEHLCYDLIYNPAETRLLRECRQHGAATQNGLPMLQRQAELSWQIWGLTE